jgi:AcrR family transcriptional regulator
MARLTRDDVLGAGLELAAEFGLDAVSIRRVAERLGVTPMALYRHVASKDDLLDGMADVLYGELRLPGDAAADWWEALAALARSTRALLLGHPWAVPLFSRPIAGPNGEALTTALQRTLRGAGFGAAEANELHHQLANIVFALVAPELHGRRNRAAFERGLELLRPGLEARLAQQ